MPTELVWSNQARTDLLEIYVMIGLEQPTAAERYFDRFEAMAELLRSQPRMGVRRSDIRLSMRMLVAPTLTPMTDRSARSRSSVSLTGGETCTGYSNSSLGRFDLLFQLCRGTAHIGLTDFASFSLIFPSVMFGGNCGIAPTPPQLPAHGARSGYAWSRVLRRRSGAARRSRRNRPWSPSSSRRWRPPG
jgi:plasmid stabilization system protein ParE